MSLERILLFVFILAGFLLLANLAQSSGKGPVPYVSKSSFPAAYGLEAMTGRNGTYDGYNHYSGQSSSLEPGTYYGAHGGTAVVATNSDGSQTITLTLQSGQTPITLTTTPPSSSSSSSSTTDASGNTVTDASGNTTESMTTMSATKFYGPNGVTATIVTTSGGQTGISVSGPAGTYIFAKQTSATTSAPSASSATSSSLTSSQLYGSTGTPTSTTDYSTAYNPPSSTADMYGPAATTSSSSSSPPPMGYMGPSASSAFVAPPSTYSSALPSGIPASAIPPGQQDLYVLKSEVWPPVCPPPPVVKPCKIEKKCPPCPPCARCPSPNFTCKKVPKYTSITDAYEPVPVVSDFSAFGM